MSLPTVNQFMCSPLEQTRFKFDEFDKLNKIIQEYLGGDCWAITINSEIIYNNYDKTRNANKIITQDTLRNHIIDKPLLLFGLFEQDKKIVIYMFKKNTWSINIIFKKKENTFEVLFFKK
jgi:hypothetical protein